MRGEPYFCAMRITLSANQNPLAELSRIAEGAMDDYFADRILDRAESYYDEEGWTLGEVSPGKLSAKVRGTRWYELILYVVPGGLELSCSCPYDDLGNCKHLAAFIWLLTEEWRTETGEALATKQVTGDAFGEYLQGLTREELIELLEHYAPAALRREVELRAAPASSVNRDFERVADRLRRMFGGGEYYEATPYQEELVARLEELRPFMALCGKALIDLLGEVWRDINERMAEGQLYDHYHDDYIDNGALLDFAGTLVLSQLPKERPDYLRALYRLREEEEQFGTFSGLLTAVLDAATDEAALRSILPALLEEDTLRLADRSERRLLYERLEPLLDRQRQIAWLEQLGEGSGDLSFAVARARLLVEEGKIVRAYHDLGVEVAAASVYNWEVGAAYGYLAELALSVEALQLAVARRPELDEDFRKGMEKNNVLVLLQYLEATDRHTLGTALLDRHPKLLTAAPAYDLLLRHADRYPELARRLAYTLLDEHLPQAQARSYREVVRAVQLLRATGAVEEFARVMHDIRTNYRRRSKLLGMLAGV